MVAIREPRERKKQLSPLHVTPDELLREMPHSKAVKYAPGEVLFKEGSVAKDCYLIVKGKLKILKKTRGGGEVNLAFVQAGEFLGEMAMISGEKRSASAVAIGRVEAVLIRHQDFEDLLKEQHPFAARLSLQFSSLLAARCQQLLGLIAQQKANVVPGSKMSRKPLDVRTVFNRVYTLWAV